MNNLMEGVINADNLQTISLSVTSQDKSLESELFSLDWFPPLKTKERDHRSAGQMKIV